MSTKIPVPVLENTIPYSAEGTEGDDYLTANTWLSGHGGNDTLIGVSGNQYLDGGKGDDYLFGERGDDTLVSSSGNDILNGGRGIDNYDLSSEKTGIYIDLSGGLLRDGLYNGHRLRNLEILTATHYDDTIQGSDENDTIYGIKGNDFINGADGNDLIISMGEDNYTTLRGGDGDDSVSGFGISYGHAGNDTIFGDVAFGGNGNDELSGRLLYGGNGNDFAYLNQVEIFDGGPGDDIAIDFYESSTFYGGSGNDTYYSSGLEQDEKDREFVDLGKGSDKALIDTFLVDGAQANLDGGDGFDILRFFVHHVSDAYDLDLRPLGEGGAVNIDGYHFENFESFYWFDTSLSGRVGLTNNSDVVIAPVTADLALRGYGGDDVLNAGGGNVRVYGGAGNDFLAGSGYGNGEEGRKCIKSGGAGNDIIFDGGSKSDLVGGTGRDIFGLAVFEDWNPSSSDANIVRDFKSGVDRIGFIDRKIFDPWIDERPSIKDLNVKVIREDEDFLIFRMKGMNSTIAYDHNDGVLLVVDGVTNGEPYGDVLARFRGTPDINIDDFVFLF